MGLVDISSGIRLRISEDRGNEARGCRLNTGALAAAAARLLGQIDQGADLLVLNKFGKAEAEGGGMRDVIAAAILADIPVLLGVGESMVEALQDFADGYCHVVEPDMI